MRIRTFKTKKSQLYFFNFLTDDGQPILKSQGYQTKDACNNGKESVLKNVADDANYDRKVDDDGNHYFDLKAANGQVIGTSVLFASEAELESGIALMKTVRSATKTGEEATTTEEKQEESSAEKSSGSKVSDDYRPLAFYEANIIGVDDGFDKFYDEAGNEHYFTYNLDNLVVLISEGYASEAGRDNGVNSVVKNLPIPERYTRAVHKNGKHYFSLKAGNHQEIATSRWFDGEADMEKAIAILIAGGKGAGVIANIFAPNTGGIYKEYRPLKFYEERIAGEAFGYDAFTDEDKYYFTVNYDGDPVLISEDYTSEAGRDNGIKSVKKNVKNEKRYVRMVHPNGMHYFNLLAGNKQEIATSRWYDSKKDMEKAITWLLGTGGTRRRKKAQREKKPAAERRYISQNQDYLCNNLKYDTFQSGGNEKFYFVFKTEEGKAILINGDVRGFATQELMEQGIKDLLANAPNEKMYEVKSTKNGKTYFYIKNKDGKNVGRSSLFYDSEDDMKAAMNLLRCVGVPMTGGAAGGSIDEYLACEAYKTGEAGFATFTNAENGEHYFNYNNEAGKVLLRSEGYTTESARDNGIESVRKNAPLAERYAIKEDGGSYYICLKAGNHQEIARSCGYDSEAAAQADLDWLLGERSTIGAGARLVDGVWMSAWMIRQKEEEAARIAAEAEAKRKAEEEAARAKAEEERKAAEAARLAAEAEKNALRTDDYLPCKSYEKEGDAFQIFDHEGQHYFSFMGNDKVLLRSEGYTTTAARDNGIDSVIKNAPIEERWKTESVLNGKYHFYYLRAGNNQEIARSCAYKSEADMLADFKWIRGDRSAIGAGSQLVDGALMSAWMIQQREEEAAAKAKAEEERKAAEAARLAAEAEKNALRTDDYLPCKAYNQEGDGFKRFDHEGQHYFSYMGNNKVLLRSEGYTTTAARDNGIESVIKNAPLAERWRTESVLDGKYHFYYLRAGNNQEIARSCAYKSEADMLADFNWIKGDRSSIGVGSKLVGGTLMSAWMIQQKEEEAARLKAEEEAKAAELARRKELRLDDYLACEEYHGEPGFHKFEKDGEHYFAYNDKDGNTLLRSEGYKSPAARDNGIESVKKNAPIKERWEEQTAMNGKYHFSILKAGNHQEIARTCYKTDKAGMLAGLGLLTAAFVPTPEPVKVAEVPTVPKEKEDDYLVCKEYENRPVNDKENNVALFKHENGQFYFAVYNKDGSVRLRSEGFGSAKDRDQELSGVLKNMDNKDMYTRITKGKYYIDVLKDKTGREVGRSCAQQEKAAIVPPVAAATAAAAAAAAPIVAASSSKKVVKEKVVVPPPPPAEEGAGCMRFWWLLLLLPLLILLFCWWKPEYCGCNTQKAKPAVSEVVTPPAPVEEAPEVIEKVVDPCLSAVEYEEGSLTGDIVDYLTNGEEGSTKKFNLDKLKFSSNSASLNSGGKSQIKELANFLKACPNTRVDLYGHIDGRESGMYGGGKDLTLSDVRARSVYRRLIKEGVSEDRLNYEGYGNSQAIDSNDTRAGRSKNRRVEVVFRKQ